MAERWGDTGEHWACQGLVVVVVVDLFTMHQGLCKVKKKTRVNYGSGWVGPGLACKIKTIWDFWICSTLQCPLSRTEKML